MCLLDYFLDISVSFLKYFVALGAEGNFRKMEEGTEIDHVGTSYDYGSVMHYG